MEVMTESPPCHGGIFRDNVSGVFEDNPNFKTDAERLMQWIKDQDCAVLGDRKNVCELWTKWINESSDNIAYIPPEGIVALPALIDDLSKVDSWALGCLAIQLINCDAPLKLKRQNRFSKPEYLGDCATLQQLQDLYKDAGQAGLAVGPEMALLHPVPCACEEFLAHCMEPDPSKRWGLHELSQLPFLNLNLSLTELFALDATHYQLLQPVEGKFIVTNRRPHPFMGSDPTLTVQVGDLQWTDGGHHPEKNVEIWRYVIFGRDAKQVEEARRVKINAFGKLEDVLTMENDTDAQTKKRAVYYGIRALQKGIKNVVHHFGCQFLAHQSFPMEFQVFTEHCPGGNFNDAAKYHIPIDLTGRWISEVLEGLKYLHGHGIVHRNLNSCLVFFSEYPFRGTVKIGGFHLMRHVELKGDASVLNGISVRRGDDGRFVAPEMMDAQKEHDLHTGRKCDTWSLGCIALHLASGQPPLYKGAKGKPIELEMAVLYHLKSNQILPEIPDWIPCSVRSFVEECLQFNPANRPYAAILDTSGVFNIGYPVYEASRGGNPLPEGVAEYWRQ
ncbi:uncharacterized protein LOC129597474 isoform X2 [Paramacrobiotus metropolitanus]|nr:uncharacterized protein LOC129597474 isoform X2 [Paramacrobiotus metropolitanus]